MALISSQISQAAGKAKSLLAERSVRAEIAQGNREIQQADHVLFFAEGPGQFYQLGAWLGTFERLVEDGLSVGLVLMDSLSAKRALSETTVPLLFTRSMEQIESKLRGWGTKSISYVNNAQRNFTMLRVNGPAHIHLNHGESEKASMVSNQLKAYDFACVAGPAAVERITENIARFDPSHLIQIGRPQLDALEQEGPSQKIRVLYAPTWEGDSEAMAYSSLAKLGERILAQLVTDDRFEVRFRPHPKTGDKSAEAAKAVTALKANFSSTLDPVSDASQSLVWADVAICDTSAMAYDAVALNIPLLLASNRPSKLGDGLPLEQRLGNANGLADRVARLAATGVAGQQKQLAQYFFATTEPGMATQKLNQLLASL
ncbi:CDP-glycerol glycerophosphotransferase family protein [Glutamicibacter sp. M10]|uniref:CDP-glycerol glycerophosphotransferase family protein n=1 Tax=Glutamicibacter sp. M10 TaxID=3023076 RepID=UPI0021C9FE3E|nr:CDP-glycerol glycerophosphotransferase family protein [Glutamicibacter sp. M10]UXN33084.1 CDP-glycerol glycerophosphotransferase family protein [Glutamicibacter sp. M10]